MNRKQHQKPFYRRPWLWIVVALLLVGGGWFISNYNQAQKTQRDSVVKTTTESDKKKKSTKESKNKGKDRSATKSSSNSNNQSANSISAQQSQQPNNEKSYPNNNSQTAPSTIQQPNNGTITPPKEPEQWVIPITMNQIQLLVIVLQCIVTCQDNILILELLLKMWFISIH